MAFDSLRRKRIENISKSNEVEEKEYTDEDFKRMMDELSEVGSFGKASRENSDIIINPFSDVDWIKENEVNEGKENIIRNDTTIPNAPENNPQVINSQVTNTQVNNEEIINNINKKSALLNEKLNNLYNNEEIIEAGKQLRDRVIENSDIKDKNLDELKQIDNNLNGIISDYAKLETKADEIKERDDFIANNNSYNINEYVNFSKRMKEKYGDNFVIRLNEEEEKQFIDLRSRALSVSKASVIEEIERAYDLKYKEILKDSEKKQDEEKIETIQIDENDDIKDKNLDEETEIEEIKKEIEIMDNEINEMLEFFNPYLAIPKVNDEINKIREKLNEINTSQIIDSLTDYIRVKEIKTNILDYLHRAQDFIKENTQEEVVEENTNNGMTL